MNLCVFASKLKPYDNWERPPQDGMFEEHNVLLNEFIKINKSKYQQYE